MGDCTEWKKTWEMVWKMAWPLVVVITALFIEQHAGNDGEDDVINLARGGALIRLSTSEVRCNMYNVRRPWIVHQYVTDRVLVSLIVLFNALELCSASFVGFRHQVKTRGRKAGTVGGTRESNDVEKGAAREQRGAGAGSFL